MWSRDCGTDTNCGVFYHGDEVIDRPSGDDANIDYFLIGVESTHDDDTEDRQWKLLWARSTKYSLEECTWHTESEYYETLQVPNSGLQPTWGNKY